MAHRNKTSDKASSEALNEALNEAFLVLMLLNEYN